MNLIPYLKDIRIAFPILLIILLGVLDVMYGGPDILHLGVEFIGGTQIPVQLEHSVDPATMSSLLTILQGRLSTFGLKQVTVEGIGNSDIFVTIPSVSPEEIQSTLSVIQSQGVFQGIVSGKEAINGTGFIAGTIGASQPILIGSNVSWSVSFFVTPQAAASFAKVVFGQADKPLYMFLDRPRDAIVLLNSSLLKSTGSAVGGSNQTAIVQALQQATVFGNQTILVEIYNPDLSNLKSVTAFFSSHRDVYSKVVLAKNTPQGILANLTSLNYTISRTTVQNITPSVVPSSSSIGTIQGLSVVSWPAVGLLSAPILSPGITNGNVSQSYQISGYSPSTLSLQGKINFATNQSTMIASVLNGGALPVHVIVGVPTTIPPTLGSHFEAISALALLIAIIAVSATVAIRYKKMFLVVPIVFTTFAELFIILSIIGLIGTIDLAAVAGMIAVIGTGVDAQIIITDEVLHSKGEHGLKMKLGNAFAIIWADAILLIVAMLPLMFSTTLISIIGFAESTILGVLFGAFITRPAYGAIISKYYEKKL
jgi:preprotein translocase subunit SecD